MLTWNPARLTDVSFGSGVKSHTAVLRNNSALAGADVTGSGAAHKEMTSQVLIRFWLLRSCGARCLFRLSCRTSLYSLSANTYNLFMRPWKLHLAECTFGTLRRWYVLPSPRILKVPWRSYMGEWHFSRLGFSSCEDSDYITWRKICF